MPASHSVPAIWVLHVKSLFIRRYYAGPTCSLPSWIPFLIAYFKC
ncbi:hypothetical protein SAMN05428978_101181 [Nitrosomonas sp. Nm34]|nr:hypothetical protein SAMN05428978_101181 [Nitrosomonas sp. Nm34]